MSKIFKRAKNFLKRAVDWVKDHWKEIVIVAAAVFTMGISTVGFAGFSAAMGAAGGGIGGFFSAVGSTMWAGVTAAAGSLGIGSGASGTAASLAGATGKGLGAAWGAGGGHGLGVAGKASAAKAALATEVATPAAGAAIDVAGGAISSALPEAGTANMASAIGSAGAPGIGAVPAGTTEITTGLMNVGAPAASSGLSDMTKAALVTTGGNMISGFAKGKMLEEEDPRGYWGVDLRGKGGDVDTASLFAESAPAAPVMELEPASSRVAPAMAAPSAPQVGLMDWDWRRSREAYV